MENSIIATTSLKKYFKTPAGVLHAVDDININIHGGETLGVVGESGCGKSTLGRVLLRLLEPTSGKIMFNGVDIAQYKGSQLKEMRKNMQMIFQDPYASLDPRMTVSEIIAEPIYIHNTIKIRADIEKKVNQLMDTVGLASRLTNSYPHELDGGRRQRIGIAKALSLEPKFIVCDEPVSALDVSIQAQILNLMMDLQERMKLTYMFITHDLSVVKMVSNEIMVMYLGQCVEKAPSNILFSNPSHPYTKALLSAIPIPSLKAREKKRIILRGEVTSPINPAQGCRFAPRCECTSEKCLSCSPELKQTEDGHYVACHLCI